MLRLASIATMLVVLGPFGYSQSGTPKQPPAPSKQEQPKGKAAPKQDGKHEPERRDRMKQRDKEVDKILNKKR